MVLKKVKNIQEKNEDINKWYFKSVLKGFFGIIFLIAFILLLAGRISYWQGWVYGIINIIVVVIQSILFANRTDLIKERLKPGPGTKSWDKVILAIYVPAFYAVVVIASLDSGRFKWTSPFPMFIYIIGYIVYIFSQFVNLWAMRTNNFFSFTVRIQKDRGQAVVQNGPYHFIRHPGYIGGILMAISSSLVLGSLWALIPASIVTILLIIRTYLEDITLQKELQGYNEYSKEVRFRLLPGVW